MALEKLLKAFSENNLKLSLDKTTVLTNKLKCFGYEVSENGITPDRNRVKKLLEIAYPTTTKQLLSFLASLNYYRCYIKNFAQLSSHLYSMTGSKSEFIMNDESRKSFEGLNAHLQTIFLRPQLTRPKALFSRQTLLFMELVPF